MVSYILQLLGMEKIAVLRGSLEAAVKSLFTNINSADVKISAVNIITSASIITAHIITSALKPSIS